MSKASEEKQRLHIMLNVLKRTKEQKRSCCWPGCEQTAISSHLLQNNGVLSEIAESGNLYELGTNLFAKSIFAFKTVGKNEALTFPGFCNAHDTDLFKFIEHEKVDFHNYRTHLLYSYRAVINERRKKEVLIDYYSKLIDSSTFKDDTNMLELFNNQQELQKFAVRDSHKYEKVFEANINDPALRDFEFISFEIPKQEVCISGTFSFETTEEVQNIGAASELTQIYFHFIPNQGKSCVIMGCEKRHKVKAWDYILSHQGELETVYKRISTIIINQLENWLCSPKFYNEQFRAKEFIVGKLTELGHFHGNERAMLNINFFEKL